MRKVSISIFILFYLAIGAQAPALSDPEGKHHGEAGNSGQSKYIVEVSFKIHWSSSFYSYFFRGNERRQFFFV
jgi:hypothetical protein